VGPERRSVSRWTCKGPLLVGFVLVFAVLALAACGGGGDSTNGSTESSGSSGAEEPASEETAATNEEEAGGSDEEGLAYAEEKVAEATTPPEHIGPETPVAKPIPSGKTIAYVNCGQLVCDYAEETLNEAAKTLGWTVKNIKTDGTPQQIQEAYEAVVNEAPDGVASLGMSEEFFPRQLKEMDEKEIPFVSALGTIPEEGAMKLQILQDEIDGKRETGPAMRLLADKAIVDSKGEGEIGIIVLTGYPTIEGFKEEFESELSERCPNCSSKSLDVPATAIGTTSDTQIANFLRANPSIHSIFLTYEGLVTDLAGATKSAGVEMPKMYSWSPAGSGFESLRTGASTAGVPQGDPELGYQIADAFARIFTGESPQADKPFTRFTLWCKTCENPPPAGENPATIENYKEQFEELWAKTLK
jgi:ABC-type sugar transport system substrate-binding protein